jgi:hypothetical protein
VRAVNVATDSRLDEPDLRALANNSQQSTWRALIVDDMSRVRRARARDAAGFVRAYASQEEAPLSDSLSILASGGGQPRTQDPSGTPRHTRVA